VIALPDVAEALRPLLQETQEHVRDLRSALGRLNGQRLGAFLADGLVPDRCWFRPGG